MPELASEIRETQDPRQSFIQETFVGSYRFSQGNPQLQALIFDWLRHNYPLDLPQDPAQLAQIKETAKHEILNYLQMQAGSGEHLKIARAAAEKDVDDSFAKFTQIYAQKDAPEDNHSLDQLTDQLTDQLLEEYLRVDWNWQNRGRSSSQAVDQLILGKPTGQTVYDQMFTALREKLRSGTASKKAKNYLKTLVEIYNTKHSAEKVELGNL